MGLQRSNLKSKNIKKSKFKKIKVSITYIPKKDDSVLLKL